MSTVIKFYLNSFCILTVLTCDKGYSLVVMSGFLLSPPTKHTRMYPTNQPFICVSTTFALFVLFNKVISYAS